jgi:hypothetical protein
MSKYFYLTFIYSFQQERIVSYRPYQYIYAPYRRARGVQSLYWNPGDSLGDDGGLDRMPLLRNGIRNKISLHILEHIVFTDSRTGKRKPIRQLATEGPIAAYFPFHDQVFTSSTKYDPDHI